MRTAETYTYMFISEPARVCLYPGSSCDDFDSLTHVLVQLEISPTQFCSSVPLPPPRGSLVANLHPRGKRVGGNFCDFLCLEASRSQAARDFFLFGFMPKHSGPQTVVVLVALQGACVPHDLIRSTARQF